MFNLKQFKLVKELKSAKPQWKWLHFSGAKNTKDELLNSLIADNKFIEEDLRIRAMVEDMIKREFPERLKDEKQYNYLVDCVVNKLKRQQLGKIQNLEEIEK